MREKYKELIKKYPELFEREEEPSPYSQRGIECGEGWYELLDILCDQITTYELDRKRREGETYSVSVQQIKEKYGTLRYYLSGADAYVNGLVAMAESMSAHICEECGEKGVLHTKAWYKVRCHECYHTEDERAQKEWEKYRAK